MSLMSRRRESPYDMAHIFLNNVVFLEIFKYHLPLKIQTKFYKIPRLSSSQNALRWDCQSHDIEHLAHGIKKSHGTKICNMGQKIPRVTFRSHGIKIPRYNTQPTEARRSFFAFPKLFVLNKNFLLSNNIHVVFNSNSTSANFKLTRCGSNHKIVYFFFLKVNLTVSSSSLHCSISVYQF